VPTPPFNIRVRDVTRGDLDALAALRPTRELHAARVCNDIDDDAKRYFLAEMSSGDAGDVRRPVGFGVIYFRGEPTWRRPDRVPLIMDLWVAPKLRRRGVGGMILRACEDAARARSFPCVFLQVQPQRDPAVVAMYERRGYQRLQQEPYRDLYAEVDDAGVLRESQALILDMQKWL
jgi:ribosomal protein S18 acetylase RimI-like enzyme